VYKLYKIFSTVPAVKTFQFKHRFRSHHYFSVSTEVLRNSEHPNAFYCTGCTLIPPLFCHQVKCHTVTDMYARWQVVLGIPCRCEAVRFVLQSRLLSPKTQSPTNDTGYFIKLSFKAVRSL